MLIVIGDNMKTIFITGLGRSGTSFLAHVLQHLENTQVAHEHIGDRDYWLLSWYLGPEYAQTYLQLRKNEIENSTDSQWFIDVNSYLQHSVEELRSVFEPSEIFHLVRNPKHVVRSIYIRRNDHNMDIVPKTKREIETWLASDKFTRICINWTMTTEQLLSQNTNLILFERLLNEDGYFEEKLLRPFGFTMNQSLSTALKSGKVNRTRSSLYRWLYARWKQKNFVREKMPPYAEWETRNKRTLFEICGPTMKKIGYPIDG